MAVIKKYSLRTYLFVLALAVTMRSAKLALAADSAASSTTTMPEVVVTAQADRKSYKPEKSSSLKYTEPLIDIPQTVTIVPESVIQAQGATTLRETLRNVPGISIQAGEGGVPAGDNMSIRGFSARTDMFVDGVRDFGGYSRDSFNFEQVEVVKGPASTYSGRGSTGGSINQVSKTPKDEAFYRGTIGFGVIDEYERYTFDLNQPLDKIGVDGAALRLDGVWHDADTTGRDFVENQRWGLAPSIAFGLDSPTQLTLSYFHLSQDNVPDYGLPWVPANNTRMGAYGDQAPPVDFDNFYGLLNRDFEETETDIVTAEIKHDFNDNLSIRDLFRIGRADRDSIIAAPRFASTTTDMITREFQSRDMVDTIMTNLTDITAKVKTWWVEHTLVAGTELTRETSDNQIRTGPAARLGDLYYPAAQVDYNSDAITLTGARNKAEADSFAPYVSDTAKLNEQWELTGGLRWDYADVSYKSTAADGRLTDLTRNDGLLSWRAGVVYKPMPNGSIYGAYGTSFNPAYEGLILSGAGNNAANVNADPEESRTIEFGTKWDLADDRLSVNAAIFRTDKTNARTEDPANPFDIVVLEGEQRVQGFEVGAAGSVTKEWHLFAAYTYLESEIMKSANKSELGKELSNTPENTLSLWTTYELPWNFEVGFGAQFIDQRFNSNINNRVAPSYWLFDAMAAYKVNKNVTLRFNIYNLADEDYIGSVGGGHFIPGAGRSAIVTTEFDF